MTGLLLMLLVISVKPRPPADVIADVHRAAAILSASSRHPVRCRMHPLDMQTIVRQHSLDGPDWLRKLCGIPVDPDCAVPRGRPAVEYE